MSDSFYRFGRSLLDQAVRLYYRRIELVGKEHVPDEGPAILVANHPNSVADAFLLASQLTSRKVNFIARDAIIQMPLLGPLFQQFGVVGVAQAMDYADQRDFARQRNELAIATTAPRLLAGEIVAIFGEGVSTDARRLGMIRKGAMRFGYAAERQAEFKLGLRWVPVGITYSAKHHLRSDVLIRVGVPFTLWDVCRERSLDPAAHEQEIINCGTERLQRELEALVVHIEQDELVGLIDRLSNLLGSPGSSLAARVERQQRLARIVSYYNIAAPERLRALEQALEHYTQKLTAVGFTDDVVRQRHPTLALWRNLLGLGRGSLLLLVGAYGGINGFIPRWCARLAAPLGRKSTPAADGIRQIDRTKQALWGTVAGVVGAAVAFPAQTYLVFQTVTAGWGLRAGVAVTALYGLTLIPSWQFYVRQRDKLRQSFVSMRDAWRFLLRARTATRLQVERRRLQRRLRELLRAYDAEAPHAA